MQGERDIESACSVLRIFEWQIKNGGIEDQFAEAEKGLEHSENVAGAEPAIFMLQRAEAEQHEDLADDRQDQVQPQAVDGEGGEKITDKDAVQRFFSGNGPSDDVFRG